MVYHQRNYSRRFEPPRRDYEPPRRDYDYEFQRQGYYDGYDGDYHHAPQVNPTSWNSAGKGGRSNFRDYQNDDYLPDYRRDRDYDYGEYDDYRRNYRSPGPIRRLSHRNSDNFAQNPSSRPVFRRYNKPYQCSFSRFRRPDYERPPPQRNFRNDRNERRYQVSEKRYDNSKRTPPPPPCNYIKFNDGGDFRAQKMQHRRIRSYYMSQKRNQKPAATTTGKPHSPPLPPPPQLPESDFMTTEGHEPYIPSPYTGPAYSSPSYSEDAPGSCSPVLEFSPDNIDLLEFTGGIAENNDVEADLE